jgi:hypothetical protein
MGSHLLSDADIDRFVEDGYVALRGAVSLEVATEISHAAASFVPNDAAECWTLGRASLSESPVLEGAVSPAVRRAFDLLAGDGRWQIAREWGFPIRLPGAVKPAWHIDGDWFTHHLTSAEQVLTPIFLWQDVGSFDSPTLLAPGSHRAVAKLIARFEPDGISGAEIVSVVHAELKVDAVIEATGVAGDVFVCHPFLAHSINPAGPSTPRLISNVAVHGSKPLALTGSLSDLTPVEAAIAHALRS